ncbi:MAG: hypothetical protein A2V66_02375 [Ignavibacteria bacterium RBG_13_36_8]|nr:MAG: hypothetical protein A2V66_02375 [Ignavibacteria bacterium RBG_13_36_8]
MSTEFKVKGKELLDKIEEIIKEGNVRKIIIKNSEGKVYMEVPLAIGVIGVLAAPIVAAIGAIAGLISNFSIEIVKKDNVDTIEVKEVKED